MLKVVRDVGLATWEGLFANRLTSMAAAIAFYTIFSLAPILIVAIAVVEPILGRLEAQETILVQLKEAFGDDTVEMLRRALARELLAGESWWTKAFGFVALLYAGTAIFVELDSALAVIWRNERNPRMSALLAEIRSRALALIMMTVVGVALLAVILAGVLLSGYGSVLDRFPLIGHWLGPALSEMWSLSITAGFFSLIYKFLPDSGRPWVYAMVPGVAVALLLELGNSAIAWYFAYTKLGSSFGAAGALAGVMVWIYYSAIIVLLAAQVSRATRDALRKDVPDA